MYIYIYIYIYMYIYKVSDLFSTTYIVFHNIHISHVQ